MQKHIAVYGGSFNPPGLHHRLIAQELQKTFDRVVVVPCGPRPDKLTTNDIETVARAAMVDMAFAGLDKVEVDLFDLEHSTFTRTHALEERYAGEGEVWHVVGTDLIVGGIAGASQIHRTWRFGSELWQRLNFAVIQRSGYEADPTDLPPHHVLVECEANGASSTIRELVLQHKPFSHLVVPRVAEYVERYGLYRSLPEMVAGGAFDTLRPLLVVDEQNPKALGVAEAYRPIAASPGTEPNVILVIGGDGTMLHAIREHWRWRLPFLGLNTGRRGFLLSEPVTSVAGHQLFFHRSPLLFVEIRNARGETHSVLACNDAWVQAAPGTTGWIEVGVNSEIRIPHLIADGALVATPAGSTAYARAMGATPIPIGTRQLLLVGSNVLEPPRWHTAALPLESVVWFQALDRTYPRKRPLLGYVDGIRQGRTVESMTVRASKIAEVELAFLPGNDLTTKLLQMQFPPFS